MWVCPRCGAPFAAPNASHSCVRVSLDDHFTTSIPAVRAAFDRLVALTATDPGVAVVPQKTRIVFAAPMRFLAIQVRRERLVGHLILGRMASRSSAFDLGERVTTSRGGCHDVDLLALGRAVREAVSRVGRRERLASPGR